MPLERRLLEQTLMRLGFTLIQGDHRFFVLVIDGRKLAETKTSHGTGYRTIREPLVARIARDLHITRAFLHQLVRGEKTREEYLSVLKEQGLL